MGGWLVTTVERQWYAGGPLALLLAPLGYIFGGIMILRRRAYRRGSLCARTNPVPVVVVGNLTVGGSGKTPLVIALTERLLGLGRRPAIVSRGYGRRGRGTVVVNDGRGTRLPVSEVGDEPAMLADRLGVPVVVGTDRTAAVATAADLGADCVVADDGFQRLSLARELSFVVVDAVRGVGNGRCLPAGPLREPVSALADANAVVARGTGAPVAADASMAIIPEALRGIQSPGEESPLYRLAGRRVHAVAGTGDPEQFFATLEAAGARVVRHPFPDHHAYEGPEVVFEDGAPLVTTEKDAVKLAEMGVWGWALRISAGLEPDPEAWLRDLPRPAKGASPGSGPYWREEGE